jgi:hypothetical protein
MTGFTCISKFGHNYTVNNHHVVTAVLEGASLKSGTEPVPEMKCIVFRYITWEKCKKCQFKRHTSLSELNTIIFVRFQSIILAFV